MVDGEQRAFEDVARVIELVTPAAPGLFLPLAATATFVRTAALTGRGSLVNGSLMQHFARNENTADVRARLEVQGRWLALVALPVGIGIFRTVSQTFATDPEEPWRDVAVAVAFYGGVVCAHLVCIWNAARVLRFETLNRARLVRQARAFRDGGSRRDRRFDAAGDEEGVFRARFFSDDPILGASLPDAARDWAHLERLVGTRGIRWREEREKIPPGVTEVRGEVTSDEGSRLGGIERDGGRPAVLLDADATPRDVLAAALAGVHASTGVRGGDDAEGFRRGVRVGGREGGRVRGGDGCERVARGFRAAGDGESVQARVAARRSGGGDGGRDARGGRRGASGWTRRSTTSSRREVDE